MTMTKLQYEVRFVTPAFLGNADQNGQWRTPPFKALLRQWWRVVYAAGRGFDVDVTAMRTEEGMLFGNAWLSHKKNGRGITDHRKSKVRLRLDRWNEGLETKTTWGVLELQPGWKISHREVGQRVGPLLYLGYGPLEVQKTRVRGQNRPAYATVLKGNAAIQAGESARLSLAVPEEHAPLMEQALWLVDRYGTLGGRSRNGWGSLALTPVGGHPRLEGEVPLSSVSDALQVDWPHAIGSDDKGPLIWRTEEVFTDWKPAMRRLAEIKIGLRTQFRFASSRGGGAPEERHWLSYPVTNHPVRNWGNNARLPNSLRFKVRLEGQGKLRPVIFHVPCSPPRIDARVFNPDRSVIESVWKRVHSFLDAPKQRLSRIAA